MPAKASKGKRKHDDGPRYVDVAPEKCDAVMKNPDERYFIGDELKLLHPKTEKKCTYIVATAGHPWPAAIRTGFGDDDAADLMAHNLSKGTRSVLEDVMVAHVKGNPDETTTLIWAFDMDEYKASKSYKPHILHLGYEAKRKKFPSEHNPIDVCFAAYMNPLSPAQAAAITLVVREAVMYGNRFRIYSDGRPMTAYAWRIIPAVWDNKDFQKKLIEKYANDAKPKPDADEKKSKLIHVAAKLLSPLVTVFEEKKTKKGEEKKITTKKKKKTNEKVIEEKEQKAVPPLGVSIVKAPKRVSKTLSTKALNEVLAGVDRLLEDTKFVGNTDLGFAGAVEIVRFKLSMIHEKPTDYGEEWKRMFGVFFSAKAAVAERLECDMHNVPHSVCDTLLTKIFGEKEKQQESKPFSVLRLIESIATMALMYPEKFDMAADAEERYRQYYLVEAQKAVESLKTKNEGEIGQQQVQAYTAFHPSVGKPKDPEETDNEAESDKENNNDDDGDDKKKDPDVNGKEEEDEKDDVSDSDADDTEKKRPKKKMRTSSKGKGKGKSKSPIKSKKDKDDSEMKDPSKAVEKSPILAPAANAIKTAADIAKEAMPPPPPSAVAESPKEVVVKDADQKRKERADAVAARLNKKGKKEEESKEAHKYPSSKKGKSKTAPLGLKEKKDDDDPTKPIKPASSSSSNKAVAEFTAMTEGIQSKATEEQSSQVVVDVADDTVSTTSISNGSSTTATTTTTADVEAPPSLPGGGGGGVGGDSGTAKTISAKKDKVQEVQPDSPKRVYTGVSPNSTQKLAPPCAVDESGDDTSATATVVVTADDDDEASGSGDATEPVTPRVGKSKKSNTGADSVSGTVGSSGDTSTGNGTHETSPVAADVKEPPTPTGGDSHVIADDEDDDKS